VVHLDAGYDYAACSGRSPRGGCQPRSRRAGAGRSSAPTPGNQYGKLRWCTERRRLVVAFWLALANAVIVCGRLVRRAWTCYRWEHRPRRP